MPTRTRIAVAQGALAALPTLTEELADTVEFVTGPTDSSDDLARLTDGAESLVVALHRLDDAAFDALSPSVRVIGRAGVGLDTIDLESARRHGVAVVYQPNYATEEVANHAVAMLLAMHRRLPQADTVVRSGWGTAADVGGILSLGECTAGVIGGGRIGRAAAQRLRPFVRDVVVYDTVPVEESEHISQVGTLDELLTVSSLVTLHVPLTPDTRHILGARELALLPQGAVLANVSRGGLLDEDAVADALESGHLGGVGLDVFEVEPLPDDSRLRTAPNVTLAPHFAWYSDASADRLSRWTVSDVLSYTQAGNVEHGRLAVSPELDRAAVRL